MDTDLRYRMLTDEEKLEYMQLANTYDKDWAAKADRAEEGAQNILRALLTGGWSFVWGHGRMTYHIGRYLYYDSRRFGNFKRRMKEKYRCNHIDCSSFPGWPPGEL